MSIYYLCAVLYLANPPLSDTWDLKQFLRTAVTNVSLTQVGKELFLKAVHAAVDLASLPACVITFWNLTCRKLNSGWILFQSCSPAFALNSVGSNYLCSCPGQKSCNILDFSLSYPLANPSEGPVGSALGYIQNLTTFHSLHSHHLH